MVGRWAMKTWLDDCSLGILLLSRLSLSWLCLSCLCLSRLLGILVLGLGDSLAIYVSISVRISLSLNDMVDWLRFFLLFAVEMESLTVDLVVSSMNVMGSSVRRMLMGNL